MTGSGKIIEYCYKSTLNLNYWEKYLGRTLKSKEYCIIKQAEAEHFMNKKITDIYKSATTKGLYVPQLTTLVGNCIFESLQYHQICDDIDKFRCGIAYLFLLFKDQKYFIPDQEMSLEELFNLTNDIETVYCTETKRLYKYTFTAMCLDLAKNTSWSRLNTQLFFLGLSVILNLKINILHNNGHITEIITIDNQDTMTIYLGLIDEFHYIPIGKRIGHPIEDSCPKYLENINNFHYWARSVAIKKQRVIYES